MSVEYDPCFGGWRSSILGSHTTPPVDNAEELALMMEQIVKADGTPVFDPITKPAHYNSGPSCVNCGETIECIVVTEPMSFCKGNVVKYLWRADHKGSSLEDLRKARWYLEREINRLEELSKDSNL